MGVASIVVYVPGLDNIVLEGGPVPFLALLAPVAAGVLLFLYECGRIFLRRRGTFKNWLQRNLSNRLGLFCRILWWNSKT